MSYKMYQLKSKNLQIYYKIVFKNITFKQVDTSSCELNQPELQLENVLHQIFQI